MQSRECPRRCGGIGRRAGLRILCPKGRGGSSPLTDTFVSLRLQQKPTAMKIGPNLDIDEQRLAEICKRFGVVELDLFGSAVRDDFSAESDVDVLYVLAESSNIGWEIVDLEVELAQLFGRPVDLVSKKYLRQRFAERVLPEARQIFPLRRVFLTR
jgi:uncharacterized protein